MAYVPSYHEWRPTSLLRQEVQLKRLVASSQAAGNIHVGKNRRRKDDRGASSLNTTLDVSLDLRARTNPNTNAHNTNATSTLHSPQESLEAVAESPYRYKVPKDYYHHITSVPQPIIDAKKDELKAAQRMQKKEQGKYMNEKYSEIEKVLQHD